MQQLAKLGLIKQVVKGDKQAGLAAEYQLLYAPDLISERPSTNKGGDIFPSPYRGGEPTSENGRRDVPLADVEKEAWAKLSAKLHSLLEGVDSERVLAQGPSFRLMAQLKRTALRVAQCGGDYEVIAALTERREPGRPAYEGATSIPAAMWARLRRLADAYGIDMYDQTPAVASIERAVPTAESVAMLEKVTGRPLVVGRADQLGHAPACSTGRRMARDS